ncbi:MAG: pyridoxamine 5'-phosphate oxidase family protein [Bdellovibrionaceae bacterium]|nr:pyridoxamine 5'-phosphate oxidase family protein [Pseudobdellovibrionaceae bacterium]
MIEEKNNFKRMTDLMEECQVAMLTTFGKGGDMHSRPMGHLQYEFDGRHLWFFTSADSAIVSEIESDSSVNVTYSEPKKQIYVAASGTGEIIDDREKIRELWTPLATAWFPKGVDDPSLRLIKIEVANAEYWEVQFGGLKQIIAIAKAITTGEQPDASGVHGRIGSLQ